jgi:diguanylate cyclase (GGDEF)-like protein/PAS domain S-box-containing protein
VTSKNKRYGAAASSASAARARRRRAEEIVRAREAPQLENLGVALSQEARHTLHELHVRQIELEVQNEELRLAQAQLDAERARYFDLYDLAPVGYCLLSAQGLVLQANRTVAAMLGLTQRELLQQPITRFILAQDGDMYCLLHQQLLNSGEPQSRELRMTRSDGSSFWAQLAASVAQGEGESGRLRLVLSDITERKHAEEKLLLAASVFAHAREGIMIVEPDGKIIDVNDAFSRITGYSRADVLGQNPRIFSSGRQGPAFYDDLWRDLTDKGHWYGEMWNRRKNGEDYPQMLNISAMRDAQGRTHQYVAIFSDITSVKEHQKQLEHIAHYDALTGLPNRVLLADRLHQGMTQAQRRGQSLVVAFIDLDGFKGINDHHGHEAGDQMLIALSARMKQTLRDGDTLARLGGDEFVAVLPDLADVASSLPMLSRLLDAAAQPVTLEKVVLQISASMGVTFYPQGQEVHADQLLRQADQAMYQAKLAGKNRYHIFDAEQDRSVRGYHENVELIRLALLAGELVLYYQPKVNMRTGAVIGAEALIRWQHPQRGLLLPAVFLPTFEEHPLAVEVGEWVIRTALKQLQDWQALGLELPVSVNIGARQLMQTDFVERLRRLLAEQPLVQPGQLELEVTETIALDDVARVSQVINACADLGVRFALDDFGTGYSSLTYLKRLPVTLLKLDQSFVRDMLGDPEDLAIIEGVLGLALAFRRQVIAEGVETLEHGSLLLQLGCDLAQGYGIACPMPAADFPGWAAAWHADSSWLDRPAVQREDVPLLFAGVEHRAWLAGVVQYIRGEGKAPLPLDPGQCRLGQWLRADALTRHADSAAYQAIESLHQQLHKQATQLLALKAQGQSPQALAGMDELLRLRDALLGQTSAWVR